jgi:uncharacterized membrane protein YtjA (UPF0391 family)
MFSWALLFAVLAIVASVFGLADLSSDPGTATRAVVLTLCGLCVACLALDLTRRGR